MSKLKHNLVTMFFLLVFLNFSSIAIAIQYNTLYTNDPISNLYTVDEADGTLSLIGSINVSRVADIAFSEDILYGISFVSVFTTHLLININPNTGDGTVIGDTGYPGMNSLAIDKRGTIYSASGANGDFIKLDPDDGSGQLIGTYGQGLTSSGDLAFAEDGTLYATLKYEGHSTDWLGIINTETGNAILVGNTGYADIHGLSFRGDTLYGVTVSGELLSINISSGLSTSVGTSSSTQWGMSTSPNVGSDILFYLPAILSGVR